jgi:rare lipoprotein A
MQNTGRRTAALAALIVAVAACDDETRTMGDMPSTETREAVAADTLAPEVLARLMEQYPSLREERAPEPEPSPDAAPGDVPGNVPQQVLRRVMGGATFYADKFEGRRTASGIPFRQNQLVAAHRSFPFGTLLRVTNLRNDRSVNVRVVDRGPFGSAVKQRVTVLDLSRRAAERLGFISDGRAQVRVEVLEWGEGVAGVVG